jgi:hypothetical protein
LIVVVILRCTASADTEETEIKSRKKSAALPHCKRRCSHEREREQRPRSGEQKKETALEKKGIENREKKAWKCGSCFCVAFFFCLSHSPQCFPQLLYGIVAVGGFSSFFFVFSSSAAVLLHFFSMGAGYSLAVAFAVSSEVALSLLPANPSFFSLLLA